MGGWDFGEFCLKYNLNERKFSATTLLFTDVFKEGVCRECSKSMGVLYIYGFRQYKRCLSSIITMVTSWNGKWLTGTAPILYNQGG